MVRYRSGGRLFGAIVWMRGLIIAHYAKNITTSGKDGCCDGCPIREDTGKQFCRLTPYKVFEDARCPEDQLKAARAMLRYLKNLRKKMYGGEV